MPNHKEYNGHYNYETWNLALWIDNDQGTHEYWREYTRDVWDHSECGDVLSRAEEAVKTLETALKDWVETNNPFAE
ncbi:hypothetical protein ABTF08_19745, partial [Acinetobacter baumannii]